MKEQMLARLLPEGSTRRAIAKTLARHTRNLLGVGPVPVPVQLERRFRQVDGAALARVASALERHFFAGSAPGYLSTRHGAEDFQNHLSTRLHTARHTVIPWLHQSLSLDGAEVLEIGCGTGSDLIALAEQGARVTAIDVDEPALAVARDRAAAYGLDVQLECANATEAAQRFAGRRFDLIIFFASIEHMTYGERLAAMRGTWEMLAPGALWAITETPNRLWIHDAHTSLLPFYHWLPDDLAFEFSRFSPRTGFREVYRERTADTMLHFLRRGRGASFHEFSLAMKPAEELDVVGCLSLFLRRGRSSPDEEFESILQRQCPRIHRGFFLRDLDLILRKS